MLDRVCLAPRKEMRLEPDVNTFIALAWLLSSCVGLNGLAKLNVGDLWCGEGCDLRGFGALRYGPEHAMLPNMTF